MQLAENSSSSKRSIPERPSPRPPPPPSFPLFPIRPWSSPPTPLPPFCRFPSPLCSPNFYSTSSILEGVSRERRGPKIGGREKREHYFISWKKTSQVRRCFSDRPLFPPMHSPEGERNVIVSHFPPSFNSVVVVGSLPDRIRLTHTEKEKEKNKVRSHSLRARDTFLISCPPSLPSPPSLYCRERELELYRAIGRRRTGPTYA